MKLKKLLAGLLAAALTVTSLSEFTVGHAVSVANAGYEPPAALTAGDMKISGANSFGDMVARELSVVSAEQAENNGCNVFSVEMEGNTAKVSFETLQDCSLVVAIYDNEGEGMIGSGYAEISKDETEAEVKINAELPEYFYIRAYLVNSDTLRPLSTEYSSPMYTREMREFLSKTADDFDPERVLNLDNDPNTNFAVFSEDTVLAADSGDKNVLVSADEKTLTYVFGNPDGSIASLSAGDVFAYDNDGELIILKVASVSTDKKSGNVTVVGEEAELEEVFEHLRIDGDVNSDNAVIDGSHMDEGVTCYGLVDDKEESGISPQALVDVTGKSEKSINFNICEKKIGIGEFSADLNLKIGASTKIYLSFSEVYVEFKLDLVNKISFEFEITINVLKKQMRLAYIAIYICPGVYFSVTPEFVLELSGKASIEGTFSVTVGFKVSSKSGIENLSSAPKFTAKGGIEVTIFFGFLLNPALSVVHEKLFNLSLETKSGVEITAKLEASTDNIDPTCIHECDICIDGEINGKFSLDITIKLLDSNRLKFSLNLLEISVHIADFYISPSFGEFAFTKCPHYKYQTFLTVKDKENAYIDGVNVVIDNNDLFEYTTKGKEELELWLTLGKHKVELDATNYKPKSTTINVKEGGKHFTVKIEKVDDKSASNLLLGISDNFKGGSSNPSDLDYGEEWDLKVKQVNLGSGHSAAITTDGSLYMWGNNFYGQLGDGTYGKTEYKYTPVKIMDNVVSISLGYSHSAAITSDSSLYMWGDNRCGQLGDGTTEFECIPIKIMDNVVSISLGFGHSAAVTSDGSLYMWGYSGNGRLGDGITENRNVLTPIKIMDNISSVNLGMWHSSAITSEGSLYMWGYNEYGQLGDGTTKDKIIPEKILDNVSSVSLGGYHSAAVTSDGNLYMWGQNINGQFGIGVRECEYAPKKILNKVSSISLGSRHSAIVTYDASLYMCGYDPYGQVGVGTTSGDKITLVKVMDNISSINLGEHHSAAITTDGSLYMWGRNDRGQLGDGTTTDKHTPTKIIFPTESPTSLNPAEIPITYNSLPASPQTTFTSLLPNETYNIYSVGSRTASDILSHTNLIYIGQAVSDASGALTIPPEAAKGTVFVKAMTEFDAYNAEITSADVNGNSVALQWNPVENAEEYEVYCYTPDGIYSQTKTTANTLTVDNLEKGKYYGFLAVSTVHGEQSIPAIGDVRMVIINNSLLGDVNSDQKVNDQDSILLSRYLSQWGNEIDLSSADMNGDRKVNDQDSIVLARTLAGWYN